MKETLLHPTSQTGRREKERRITITRFSVFCSHVDVCICMVMERSLYKDWV